MGTLSVRVRYGRNRRSLGPGFARPTLRSHRDPMGDLDQQLDQAVDEFCPARHTIKEQRAGATYQQRIIRLSAHRTVRTTGGCCPSCSMFSRHPQSRDHAISDESLHPPSPPRTLREIRGQIVVGVPIAIGAGNPNLLGAHPFPKALQHADLADGGAGRSGHSNRSFSRAGLPPVHPHMPRHSCGIRAGQPRP